ncbi:Protein of unknown function DUF3115 [Penicillium capsulatum]|uniref:25S rRNA (Uridine(2843)-N(3))-methyltransferase n=1 Tax=Penicillium capsulatum TaxID=69766 RepID=A0A9W9I2X6_9EURO|nr:Protein of unknown function DUF3115 [Penicillium capsulatum]KAJ6116881.1 Protein of unknown function DUF3115 [Penicillium capsulatum]
MPQGDRKKNTSKPKASRRAPSKPERKPTASVNHEPASSASELISTIPISLQQLLLDVFKTALLTTDVPSESTTQDIYPTPQPDTLDTKSLVQTIKSHLYQRDFDSAFTDAGEDLLRAYALRWSASRALGYAGLFKGVLRWMQDRAEQHPSPAPPSPNTRIVSIGGGAGAEIVALAAAWRDLDFGVEALAKSVADVSLESGSDGPERTTTTASVDADVDVDVNARPDSCPRLAVSAVDIADWSSVVQRLSRTLVSAAVPAQLSSKHRPPLVPAGRAVDVGFRRADVLTVSEDELKGILLDETSQAGSSLLVTLMFTLNELFSTSMPKTTGFLLRLSDLLPSGAVLLVVDSPGSYSTLKLGKGKDGTAQERQYPMKFLLDHTLLSVAAGKWERVYTQDSRWWRRDAARLKYEVGEGAGLEDMRFQVHLYRRI